MADQRAGAEPRGMLHERRARRWPTRAPLPALVEGVRVVNLGSLSNAAAPDLRAKYTILEADAGGYRLDHRRVEYDHAAVIAAVEALRHPAGGYINAFQRGERRAPWSV